MIKRLLEPAAIRYYQWRGDPLARLLHPSTKIDPYPLYDDLRQHGLLKSPLGSWVTSTHATVEKVLRDQRFSSSPVHQRGYQPPTYTAEDPRTELPTADLLSMDPPDHTRLRRLVSSTFSPKSIAALEPWIREATDRILSSVDAPAGFDLIDQVAFPLPIAVICHLLGVPSKDQASFRVWGHDVATNLEPQTESKLKGRSLASEIALTAYLRDLVHERRANPDDSLFSALVAAEEEGDRLSADELVNTALLLLVAGFETTVNLIGNGTVALLGEAKQWARLHADASLVPAAIEELLRYDSPVQLTSRTATEDVDLDGARIAKGASVIVVLGGANRDPEVFEQPEQLRIDRSNASRHLSFSLGIHHCLGAALARLEGRVVIEELTRRYPTLEMAGVPTRRPLLVLRGFDTVPVRA